MFHRRYERNYNSVNSVFALLAIVIQIFIYGSIRAKECMIKMTLSCLSEILFNHFLCPYGNKALKIQYQLIEVFLFFCRNMFRATNENAVSIANFWYPEPKTNCLLNFNPTTKLLLIFRTIIQNWKQIKTKNEIGNSPWTDRAGKLAVALVNTSRVLEMLVPAERSKIKD